MTDQGIRTTYAAPRHLEQNGICESSWQHIRNTAFTFMNDAHVDMPFFPLALKHAWKVHAVLPQKALTKASGISKCPHNVSFNKTASISDFKVLFCPAIMTYGSILVSNRQFNDSSYKRPRLEVLNRKNNPQRGMRGNHVGLSRTSKTFMIYVPSTGRIYHTRDCYFDENYESTLAYKENKFSGYMHLHITKPFPDMDLPFHRVDTP
jgi:hypothetical protein